MFSFLSAEKNPLYRSTIFFAELIQIPLPFGSVAMGATLFVGKKKEEED